MGLKVNSGDIIFVDTLPFIYFFEQDPTYFPFMKRFLMRFTMYQRKLLALSLHISRLLHSLLSVEMRRSF